MATKLRGMAAEGCQSACKWLVGWPPLLPPPVPSSQNVSATGHAALALMAAIGQCQILAALPAPSAPCLSSLPAYLSPHSNLLPLLPSLAHPTHQDVAWVARGWGGGCSAGGGNLENLQQALAEQHEPEKSVEVADLHLLHVCCH